MSASPLILFDNECILCQSATAFILKHERDQTIHFTHIQSDLAKELKKKFHFEKEYTDSLIFIENNKVFTKSDAVIRILRYLKFPYRLLYYFSFLSFTPINNFIYDLISKYRNRILGKSKKCILPDKKNKHRFVT